MKTATKTKKRAALALQYFRLKAANDRREAYLKAHPRLDLAEVWNQVFKVRRPPPSESITEQNTWVIMELCERTLRNLETMKGPHE